MGEKLRIAGISVEPRKKVAKKIKIGSLYDNSPLEIPIILINGRESGPILCLNSGMHGNELTGIEIVRRAALEIDPNELSGAVVAIPGCNPLAYVFGVHHIWDNPWLSFPGNPWGSWDKRLVYFLFNNIFSKTNYILDFHSGNNEVFERYIYVVDTSETYKKVGRLNEELARAFGTGLPVLRELVKVKQPLLAYYAGMEGIPVITPEIGGGQTVWEEDVKRGVKGIENVMKYLKMIEGKPEPSEQIFISQIQTIWATHGGFLVPEVSPLRIPCKVSKGQVIARITDLLGNEVDVIKSELDGVLYLARLSRAVKTGDWLYELGSGTTTFPPEPMVSEEVYT